MLNVRAAQGDGAEEIRGGDVDGNGIHQPRQTIGIRSALHCHVVQYGIRPAAQEGQGCAALNADRSSCAFGRTDRGCRAFIRRIGSSIRICRSAGFSHCSRRVGGGTPVLGRHIVLFQILGVSPGLVGTRRALIGPLGPPVGVLVLVFIIIPFRFGTGVFIIRGSVGVCLGVVLEHTRSCSRNVQIARGDAALCSALRSCSQFPGEGSPCNISCQNRIRIDLPCGLCHIRSIIGGLFACTDPAAIVADHGNAVHVIIDNAHANAKRLGARIARRAAASGVVHVGRIAGFDGNLRRVDGDFIVQGDDAVAVPVGKSHHARNADGIPLAGVLDFVLHVERIVRRGVRGTLVTIPREFHAFPGHDQAVAADVLDACRGADANFGVGVFCTIGAFCAGCSIRSQLDFGTFHLALLSQQHNRIVLQGVNTHRTGQRKRRGSFFLRRALGAYSVGQGAGFFFGLGFSAITVFSVAGVVTGVVVTGAAVTAVTGVAFVVVSGTAVTAAFSASTGPRSCSSVLVASRLRSGASGSSILFGRRRVFSHACRYVQRYLTAIDLGRFSPITVHQDRSVVLHIADQNGCADFYLGGVGQRILYSKLQGVFLLSGGCHQGFSRYVDRTVRPILDRRGGNDDVLPNGHIGVVCIGNDAYAGPEAKNRRTGLLITACVTARIGTAFTVSAGIGTACIRTACIRSTCIRTACIRIVRIAAARIGTIRIGTVRSSTQYTRLDFLNAVLGIPVFITGIYEGIPQRLNRIGRLVFVGLLSFGSCIAASSGIIASLLSFARLLLLRIIRSWGSAITTTIR